MQVKAQTARQQVEEEGEEVEGSIGSREKCGCGGGVGGCVGVGVPLSLIEIVVAGVLHVCVSSVCQNKFRGTEGRRDGGTEDKINH